MKSHSGGTYVWEVKPNKPRYYGGKIGTIQLTEYIVKANNSNFVVSKGDVIFETLFSAGMPVTPFNLTIPDFTDDDLTTCLKVTPSPYAESILYENGLILYQEIDESDGDLQTYDCTQTQLSLLNENATIVAPSTVKVGVRDLVYTRLFGVVEGVVIGICIISAPIHDAVSLGRFFRVQQTSARSPQLPALCRRKCCGNAAVYLFHRNDK